MEPDIDSCFAVISTENIETVFFGPEIDHLASGVSEGIGKGCTEVGTEGCTEEDER